MGKKVAPNKTLTKEEFLKLELVFAKDSIFKKDKEIRQLMDKLLRKEHVILQYMLRESQFQIDKHGLSSVDSAQLENHKKNKEQILGGIKKRLKIKGRFGYDPDSLEVTTGDEDK